MSAFTWVHSLECIRWSAFAGVHSMECIHWSVFTGVHSLESIQWIAFSGLHSPECIHLSEFNWVHSLECIQLSAFSWVHSVECIHLSAFTGLHSHIVELRIPISVTDRQTNILTLIRWTWAVYRAVSQLTIVDTLFCCNAQTSARTSLGPKWGQLWTIFQMSWNSESPYKKNAEA